MACVETAARRCEIPHMSVKEYHQKLKEWSGRSRKKYNNYIGSARKAMYKLQHTSESTVKVTRNSVEFSRKRRGEGGDSPYFVSSSSESNGTPPLLSPRASKRRALAPLWGPHSNDSLTNTVSALMHGVVSALPGVLGKENSPPRPSTPLPGGSPPPPQRSSSTE
eukprot:TRINITY_DN65758_c9_g6_i1.p1 TRINITY_DN65758_c9_g6~~TRINITY_DN65758_c9_g6_i1.p1  ORF type:complete len:165 (-),score=18.84 TRINITY_DN65758_c9_g6_i1:55-549(-)